MVSADWLDDDSKNNWWQRKSAQQWHAHAHALEEWINPVWAGLVRIAAGSTVGLWVSREVIINRAPAAHGLVSWLWQWVFLNRACPPGQGAILGGSDARSPGACGWCQIRPIGFKMTNGFVFLGFRLWLDFSHLPGTFCNRRKETWQLTRPIILGIFVNSWNIYAVSMIDPDPGDKMSTDPRTKGANRVFQGDLGGIEYLP